MKLLLPRQQLQKRCGPTKGHGTRGTEFVCLCDRDGAKDHQKKKKYIKKKGEQTPAHVTPWPVTKTGNGRSPRPGNALVPGRSGHRFIVRGSGRRGCRRDAARATPKGTGTGVAVQSPPRACQFAGCQFPRAQLGHVGGGGAGRREPQMGSGTQPGGSPVG